MLPASIGFRLALVRAPPEQTRILQSSLDAFAFLWFPPGSGSQIKIRVAAPIAGREIREFGGELAAGELAKVIID